MRRFSVCGLVLAVFSMVLGFEVVDPPPTAAVEPLPAALPPCETEPGGGTSGPCPLQTSAVSASVSGEFADGSTVSVATVPSMSACDTWGNVQVWVPSPCYDAVASPSVVGCGYINAVTEEWNEVGCGSLYVDTGPFGIEKQSEVYVQFTPGPHDFCGAEGQFGEFYWGGDATDPPSKWINRGPTALDCDLTLTGGRPDGLYGPTWAKVRVGVKAQANNGESGRWEFAETYVPLRGDLRDVGPIAGFDAEPTGEPGEFRFVNWSYHPTGESLSYEWNFDDGSTSQARSPLHTFDSPGEYLVRLVVDDGEQTDDAQETVAVTGAFVWSMEPRFLPDDDGTLPLTWSRTKINPGTFRVNAVASPELCAVDFELKAAGVPIEILDRDQCDFAFELAEGDYAVSVLVDGAEQDVVDVTVDDLLLVIIGDSLMSGEGTVDLNDEQWSGPVRGCHRSDNAAGAQAGLELERASAATSVTVVLLACSGATTRFGLLGDQTLTLSLAKVNQLEELDDLVDREIDALVMSIGVNDYGFGDALFACAQDGPRCDRSPWAYVLEGDAFVTGNLTSGAKSPGEIATHLCADVEAGDESITIAVDAFPGYDEDNGLLRYDARGWDFSINPWEWDYSDERTADSNGVQTTATSTQRELLAAGTGCIEPSEAAWEFAVEGINASYPRFILGNRQVRDVDDDGLISPRQPHSPEVYVEPPTLGEWVAFASEDLTANLASVKLEIDGPLHDVDETFVMMYPDLLTDSTGQPCANVLASSSDPDAGLSRVEVEWAKWDYLQSLNSTISSSLGDEYTLVNGIWDGFLGRGYCAEGERWTTTLSESLQRQGDPYGAMHPNAAGHAYMADRLVETIRGQLASAQPIPYDGYVPPSAAALERFAQKGFWRIFTDATDFDIGDLIEISPGTDYTERAVVGGFGSLLLTAPLEHWHPAGAEVRLVEPGPGFVQFADVVSGSWYENPVTWARLAGITTGTSPSSFSPDVTLTRAQLFTLVWRALGSPAAAGDHPFGDTEDGAFYDEAVRWAYSTGVTTGVSPTRFGPDDPTTRGQVAAVLWRLVDSPFVDGGGGFSDVALGRFYSTAVAWMAQQEITTGVAPGVFGPDRAITRAMAVTFLHRMAMANLLA